MVHYSLAFAVGILITPAKGSGGGGGGGGGGCGGFEIGGVLSRSEYATSISPGYLGTPPPSKWTCVQGEVEWELAPHERR